MATLTFTSAERGTAQAPNASWTAGGFAVKMVTHIWGGFQIMRLRHPKRDGAVILPRTYLIAKLALGAVPYDYGVDLENSTLYQRTENYRHPAWNTGYTGEPRFLPSHETMTLTFVEGEDDPIWDGEEDDKPTQVQGGQNVSLVFEAKGRITFRFGAINTFNGENQRIYMPDYPGAVTIFDALLAPPNLLKNNSIYVTKHTAAELASAPFTNAFFRRLELKSHRAHPEEETRKGRAPDLSDGRDPWLFPVTHFEMIGGMWLAYDLTPDGTGLRPFARPPEERSTHPTNGRGRLLIHHAADAWRFVALLPGRRAVTTQYGSGIEWLAFFHAFAVTVPHREVGLKTRAFRGLPLPEQEMIWQVPGMSSALSHCFNSIKPRIAALPAPMDRYQEPCQPKHGHMLVFPIELTKWAARLPGGRKMEHYDTFLADYRLGRNKLTPDWSPTVKLVAPAPLTSGRLIDL